MSNLYIAKIDRNNISFTVTRNQYLIIHNLAHSLNIDPGSFYITCNGKLVTDCDFLHEGECYRVIPRILGGKGGFGSMLRALGAQIEKTTNREACRDLSGRRMKDVNNEKKLREWVANAAEREKIKAEKKRQKREQVLNGPRHKFDDPEYDRQKKLVAEGLDDALQQGLQQAAASSSKASRSLRGSKRKADDTSLQAKKAKEWLGIDATDLTDSDSDSSESPMATAAAAASELEPCSSHQLNDVGRYDEESSEPSQSSLNQNDIIQETPKSSEISEQHHPGSSVERPVSPESRTNDSCPQLELIDSCPPPQVDDNSCPQLEMEKVSVERTVAEQQQAKISSSKNSGLMSALCGNIDDSGKPHQPSAAESHPTSLPAVTINLLDFNSAKELEALGLDTLKSELTSRGLKCGGTLQQRADRLFSVRGLNTDQINPALLAKPQRSK